jgi:regulator of protease activity HflC (stomatin/prohibitin superfamily)
MTDEQKKLEEQKRLEAEAEAERKRLEAEAKKGKATIEALALEFAVDSVLMVGLKVRMGWVKGETLTRAEFKKALEQFSSSPTALEGA